MEKVNLDDGVFYTGDPLDLSDLTLKQIKLLLQLSSKRSWDRWETVKGKSVQYLADCAKLKANSIVDTKVSNVWKRQSNAAYYVKLFDTKRIDDVGYVVKLSDEKLRYNLTKVRRRLIRGSGYEKTITKELEVLQLNSGTKKYLDDVGGWDDRKLMLYINKHLKEFGLVLSVINDVVKMSVNDAIITVAGLISV
jgi:hypothetical protein